MLCTVHPSASVASNHSASLSKSPSPDTYTEMTSTPNVNKLNINMNESPSPPPPSTSQNNSESRFQDEKTKRSRTPSAAQHAGPGKKLRFACSSSSVLSSLTDSESDVFTAPPPTAPHGTVTEICNLDPSPVSEPPTPPPTQDGPLLTPRSGHLNASASLGSRSFNLQTEIDKSFEEDDEEEHEEIDNDNDTTNQMHHILSEARLIQVMSNEVEDQCVANENVRFEPYDVVPELRIFFSQYKQPFPMAFYVERLVQYANCSQSAFISALIYLDRVHARSSALVLTEMNSHRLLSTALVLAIKYLDDEVYSNAYYARVSGLTTNELNMLETSMLSLLDWRLSIDPALYRRYEHSLFRASAILDGQEVPSTPEN